MMTIPTCRAWRFCVTQFLVVMAAKRSLAYKPLTGNGDKISHVTFYSAVPSPSSTVALVGLGAMGLLALLRRRRALSHEL